MAKQLPITSDPTYMFQIYSSLRRAHHSLSSFLFSTQTQFPLPPPPAAENSLSSITDAANADGTNPMQVGNENNTEVEENLKTSIDKVEERLRECFIKNKRVKRQLSLSSVAVAEERRIFYDRFAGGFKGLDPLADKLRALDLVYQFHGLFDYAGMTLCLTREVTVWRNYDVAVLRTGLWVKNKWPQICPSVNDFS
ncbi:Ribosomal RNA adenine dimethylase family protein [Hibiscus syriacus]|uniref:Ribosomal RNA adenine dimethylase family protein n=1 Tax=Hibiscus syriacus TaxID=106335 RepID=A0A6A2YNU2_HIBSY|nr:Ribosomal RNA adenine dimethylase family protein [Hibiscus syriacus]